jgi:hypothetical protein
MTGSAPGLEFAAAAGAGATAYLAVILGLFRKRLLADALAYGRAQSDRDQADRDQSDRDQAAAV